MENFFNKLEWGTIFIGFLITMVFTFVYTIGRMGGDRNCTIEQVHNACNNYDYTLQEIQDCHENAAGNPDLFRCRWSYARDWYLVTKL